MKRDAKDLPGSRRAPRGGLRPYVEETAVVPVRFDEVDALRIVWHGRYVSYFEEGRRALGRRLGIDYPTFMEKGVAVPLIHLAIDFLAPAKMTDTLRVQARLLKPESARLDFEYEVRRDGDGTLLATGRTSQVFATPNGELLLTMPPFMRERLLEWQALWKNP